IHSRGRSLASELLIDDGEDQVAHRMSGRWVARLVRRGALHRHEPPLGKPYKLQISDYGSLDNLRLVALERNQPAPGEIEIETRASGLNFRDVLHALGLLQEHSAVRGVRSSADLPFGFECAGVVSALGEGVRTFEMGQPVIALTYGAMNRFVIAS